MAAGKVNQSVRCCGSGKNGTVGKNILPILSANEMDQLDLVMINFVKLLKKNGKEVYFVLDNPFGEELDAHSMLQRSWRGFVFKKPPELRRDVALDRSEPVRSRIISVANQTGAKVIDPLDYLCDTEICPAFSSKGELLYKDYDHLSIFASKFKINYLNILQSN